MDAPDDTQLAHLLARAQDGDRGAYEEFLRGASVVLRRFLARRMRDGEPVEDVLQDTLLAIHKARHSYLPGRPVGPWLYAICEHRMTDLFRRKRRLERMEQPASGELVERAGSEARAVEVPPGPRAERALDALRKLPGRQRRVVELLKLHDLSVKEVAVEVGMSESAVKVTAFRGYQALRAFLGVTRR